MINPANSISEYRLQPDSWVAQYADTLFGFVCARISDRTTAEDIVQDTFLSAWRARDGYKGDATEKNWLFSICKNKIIDYYRKQSRELQKTITGLSDSGLFDERGHWLSDTVPQEWTASADASLMSSEFYEILEKCKNRLREMQQAVFVLKYMDDMDSDEICKELNISSSNYWTLMHRAKLQLRGCLEKNWFNTAR